MRRPASRPVSSTRRTSGDTAEITVRAGAKDIGTISRLGAEEGDRLGGSFNNRPAFADVAAVFAEHARAVASGDAADAAARATEIVALGCEVWHSVHDMRIDEPGTLLIGAGRASFRPNGAFLMMRTGGL
jgi:hypothetical protein